MVNRIVYTIICSLLTISSVSQSVSLIKSYDNTYKATDVLATEDGSVYICGRASMPFVIKLDTAGNELWVKYLPEFPDVGSSVNPEIFSFLHLVSDGNGGVIAYGRNEYNDDTHGLVRISSNGDVVWTTQNIIGDSYNLTNSIDNIWADSDFVYLGLPIEDTLAYTYVFYKIGIDNGSIDRTLLTEGGAFYISKPSLINGKWVFQFSSNKLLKLSPDFTYELETFKHIGAMLYPISKGFLMYNYSHVNDLGSFEVWESSIFTLNTNLDVVDSISVTSDRLIQYDSSYVTFSSSQKVNIIKNKGLVVGGNAAWRNMGNTESGTWFAQLNPDDISVKWDTILPTNSGVVKIDDNGRDSYAIGATSLGSYGVEVFRITDLDTFHYQTDFSVSANEDLGLAPFNSLKIYPNPTRDKVSVSWEQDEPVTIQVYGISGALLVNQEISGSQTQLDISQLPAGVYVVVVKGANTNNTSKLIIDK